MTLLTDRDGVARHARPRSDLARLISPISPETFEQEYWERKPLLIQRDDPDYYADLLTLDDVDQVLSLSAANFAAIRIVINGKETQLSELHEDIVNGMANTLEALYARYRGGSTIVLNSLNGQWPPLQRFANSLGREVNARIQTNIYLTPPGNRGFVPHYDMHDVLIAQVHGTKHWRLASQPYALPLKGQPYDKSQPEPEPEQEFDLRAGDLLYLPRGTIHSGTANEHTSVHITIGVHPVLYVREIEDAVKRVFTEDVRFRMALPIGFTEDPDRRAAARDRYAELLDELRARLSADELVDSSVRRATSIGLPNLRHHLTDLEAIERIDLTTRVRRRPDLRFHLTADDDVVRLDFHNKTVQLPAIVTDEVRYVASSNGDGCDGASIPGDLDADGRLVLITTLLREGFLTRVG
jgi:ribosomal protein L16 Arg81 hydroxylase